MRHIRYCTQEEIAWSYLKGGWNTATYRAQLTAQQDSVLQKPDFGDPKHLELIHGMMTHVQSHITKRECPLVNAYLQQQWCAAVVEVSSDDLSKAKCINYGMPRFDYLAALYNAGFATRRADVEALRKVAEGLATISPPSSATWNPASTADASDFHRSVWLQAGSDYVVIDGNGRCSAIAWQYLIAGASKFPTLHAYVLS